MHQLVQEATEMTDTQDTAVQEPAQEPTATQQNQPEPAQAETPPWGDDFDPEKAWNLVKNLRADKEKLAARPVLTDEQKQQLAEYNQLREASKTDAERREEAQKAAEQRAAEAETAAIRYKIALRHGISEDDFDLLGSGTEEQVEARAAKIAAKNEKARQAELEAAVQPPATPTPRRPSEQLRPGASPSPAPVQDDSYYPSGWLSPSQRAAIERSRNS